MQDRRTAATAGKARFAEKALAVFAAGWLLANFPLLTLAAGSGATWGGLPLMPLVLLLGWALFIAAMAWLLEGRRPDPGAGVGGAPD